MAITRRHLLASAVASLAAPSILMAAQTIPAEIKSSVRVFNLRTSRTDDDLLITLRGLSGKDARVHAVTQTVISTVIEEGSPLSLPGGDAALSGLGNVEPILAAQMTSLDGSRSPLALGKDVPYVKSIVDGHETLDVIKTGLSLHIEPKIKGNQTIDLRVAHQVTEIEGMEKFDTGVGTLLSLPRVHKAVALFSANVEKGQSILCMSRSSGHEAHSSEEQSFVLTLITPQIVA